MRKKDSPAPKHIQGQKECLEDFQKIKFPRLEEEEWVELSQSFIPKE